MSSTTSTTASISDAKPTSPQQAGSKGKPSQNFHRKESSNGHAKKPFNGSPKGSNKHDGQNQKPKNAQGSPNAKKAANKSLTKNQVSDYLRDNASSQEIVSMVHTLSADFHGYFSEPLILATLESNNNNLEAARTALAKQKQNSWASKVGGNTAVPAPSSSNSAAPQQQQEARPPKNQKRQQQHQQHQQQVQVEVPVVVAPEPVVEKADPAEMLSFVDSQQQELREIRDKIGAVTSSQSTLMNEKSQLEEEIERARHIITAAGQRIHQIDADLAQHERTLTTLRADIKSKFSGTN